MHKQHHTFTNNIDKDPELTSFVSRGQLENPAFRNMPESRWSWFKQFWDVCSTFKRRLFRPQLPLLEVSLLTTVEQTGA